MVRVAFVGGYFSKCKIARVVKIRRNILASAYFSITLRRVTREGGRVSSGKNPDVVIPQVKFHQPIFQLLLLISIRMELRIYWLFDYTDRYIEWPRMRVRGRAELHFVHQIYFHRSNELLMQAHREGIVWIPIPCEILKCSRVGCPSVHVFL